MKRRSSSNPCLRPGMKYPPLDFFSENLVPGKIRDSGPSTINCGLKRVVPQEELLNRAENLRRGTQTMTGVATPGYRVNPPSPGLREACGGPPIGGQPYYPLPTTASPARYPAQYPAATPPGR